MANEILLPYHFTPRDYQLPFLRVFDDNINNGLGKIRKFIKVWHRRSGKEKVDTNVVAKQMQQDVGTYFYIFPTYSQGKKILWEGMDKDGFRFIDHFPKSILDGKPNDSEMKLRYKNGSLFQIIGSDNINSIVGTNPKGCIFSEYSLQDPRAWDFMRPIIAENGGWALFNMTPRGENHGKDLWDLAGQDPENWFNQLLTVDDTHAITQEVLDQERKEIIRLHGNDALYQQEYMCSFTAPIPGSYYASHMMAAQNEGRICSIPWESSIPVDTYWDLGIDDSMTIGFVQIVGKEIRFIDYIESNGEGLPYYFKLMQEKPYIYGNHYAPHDIEVRELSSGHSRRDIAASLGVHFRVAPKLGIDDGIGAVRMVFNKIWIEKDKCKRLTDALRSYCKEYDDKNKVYKNKPLHDWSSHAADMIRTFATSFNLNQMAGSGRTLAFGMNKGNAPQPGTLAYAAMQRDRINNNHCS